MPRLLVLLLLLCVIPALAANSAAGEDKILHLYFFWSHGCPHCLQEKPFLEKIKQKYPALSIHAFEVSGDRENLELLKRVAATLRVEVPGVPFTVVGRDYLIGWQSEETSGAALEAAIQKNLAHPGEDVMAELAVARPPDAAPDEKKVIGGMHFTPVYTKCCV